MTIFLVTFSRTVRVRPKTAHKAAIATLTLSVLSRTLPSAAQHGQLIRQRAGAGG
jgi:hypothetical protein